MGYLFQGFGIHYCHRTGQVGLFLRTVTHYHHLFKHQVIGVELDRFKDGTVTNGNFTVFVTDITYHKDGLTGHFQLEITV